MPLFIERVRPGERTARDGEEKRGREGGRARARERESRDRRERVHTRAPARAAAAQPDQMKRSTGVRVRNGKGGDFGRGCARTSRVDYVSVPARLASDSQDFGHGVEGCR